MLSKLKSQLLVELAFIKWSFKTLVDRHLENVYLFLAHSVLPSRLVMWCFIVVYGLDGNAPSDEFKTKLELWCKKRGL